MLTYQHEERRHIAASPQEVFTILADVARHDALAGSGVTMVIETISSPVRWTFARELIPNGLFEPTGDGDVHVWPCLDTEGAALVIIELNSPTGGAILQIPHGPSRGPPFHSQRCPRAPSITTWTHGSTNCSATPASPRTDIRAGETSSLRA